MKEYIQMRVTCYERVHMRVACYERVHMRVTCFVRVHMRVTCFERVHLRETYYERVHMWVTCFERVHMSVTYYERVHLQIQATKHHDPFRHMVQTYWREWTLQKKHAKRFSSSYSGAGKEQYARMTLARDNVQGHGRWGWGRAKPYSRDKQPRSG